MSHTAMHLITLQKVDDCRKITDDNTVQNVVLISFSKREGNCCLKLLVVVYCPGVWVRETGGRDSLSIKPVYKYVTV